MIRNSWLLKNVPHSFEINVHVLSVNECSKKVETKHYEGQHSICKARNTCDEHDNVHILQEGDVKVVGKLVFANIWSTLVNEEVCPGKHEVAEVDCVSSLFHLDFSAMHNSSLHVSSASDCSPVLDAVTVVILLIQ